jgi:glycosyltransferase involved in cell wall biosynthesis
VETVLKKQAVRLILVADTFPPLRTSGAVQLRDLSRELVRQGHQLSVLLPSADLDGPWHLETWEGVRVLRLQAPKTKDIGYIRRTLHEFWMPFAMRRQLLRSPLAQETFDGVVWYSPSIFHGPLVQALKRQSCCPAYLIIRDIFPEWAVDMGLMGRGLPYRFFDLVARYQYAVADVIGVQTPGNLTYFSKWKRKKGRLLVVLQNWLAKPAFQRSSIQVDQTALAERKVFVYAGNMGVAQGMGILLELADRLQSRRDVGFLFVGRGSDVVRLRKDASDRGLTNVLFFDEIDPDEIPSLYAQCTVGLVALDARHRSHNIPGKFLTYIQSGLPVLACVNLGNDLADLIRIEAVGQVCESHQIDDIVLLAEKLLVQLETDGNIRDRCKLLFERRFSVEQAVSQIVDALSNDKFE